MLHSNIRLILIKHTFNCKKYGIEINVLKSLQFMYVTYIFLSKLVCNREVNFI